MIACMHPPAFEENCCYFGMQLHVPKLPGIWLKREVLNHLEIIGNPLFKGNLARILQKQLYYR